MSKCKDDLNIIKMYIIVNDSLKMGKGKISSQVGHAVSGIIRKLEKRPSEYYNLWLNNGEPKIVLKANENTILDFIDCYTNCLEIKDCGKTQIKPDSLTCIIFEPLHLENKKTSELVTKLKSLKIL